MGGATSIRLGCVLYEMLAGEPPFTGPTAQAIIARRLSSPVPTLRTVRETVSPAVERAIEVALAKVPADRFATTDEFVAALDAAGPSDAKPSAAVRGIPRRWVAIAAGIAVAVVAAALALQRWSTPAIQPDAGLVAVIPFRIASSDSSLAYLHEGLVDLFAAKLNGEAGPSRWIPVQSCGCGAHRPRGGVTCLKVRCCGSLGGWAQANS